ncbi:Rv3654c family TadE-like protein [Streptomyces sp. CAS3]
MRRQGVWARVRASGWARVPARRTAGRCGSDRGSATVWSLGAIAVLCVVFGAVLALGHAVTVRHRAAGGADLAALAAADHWAEGGEAACALAGRVASAQEVRLVRCTVEGDIADVTAASGSGPFTAEIRSRAGPTAPRRSLSPHCLPPCRPPARRRPLWGAGDGTWAPGGALTGIRPRRAAFHRGGLSPSPHPARRRRPLWGPVRRVSGGAPISPRPPGLAVFRCAGTRAVARRCSGGPVT